MDKQRILRSLPKIDELLKRADLTGPGASAPRPMMVDAVREAIEDVRARVLEGEPVVFSDDSIAADAVARASARLRPSLRPVINATGIIVHTNLGRSRLSEEAL